jgi:hypothetical protein
LLGLLLVCWVSSRFAPAFFPLLVCFRALFSRFAFWFHFIWRQFWRAEVSVWQLFSAGVSAHVFQFAGKMFRFI